jgi:hypothetical protein
MKNSRKLLKTTLHSIQGKRASLTPVIVKLPNQGKEENSGLA